MRAPVTLATLIAAVVLTIASPPARAAQTPLTGTGWVIEYDPAKVISPTFCVAPGCAGTPNSGVTLDGTLDIDRIIFTDLNSIDIQFTQVEQLNTTAINTVNFGLRITSAMEIENSSGVGWSGFIMELIDSGPEFDSGETLHPGYAHFHNILASDGTLLTDPFTTVSPARNPTSTLRTDRWFFDGGGIFANGASSQWSGIGIHQWERFDENRNFILRLTPVVPAPSSLVLFGAGGAGLLGLHWLRVRPRRPRTLE